MLPVEYRMRRSADFRSTIHSGVRRGRAGVLVHLTRSHQHGDVLVGFVVSKAVGNAVVRNRVKRRLRAAMAPRCTDLMAGSRVVVRALPSSANLSFSELNRQLDAAMGDAIGRWERLAERTEC